MATPIRLRSEEHTSELQSQSNLVCRLLLEKKRSRHVRLRAAHGCTLGDLTREPRVWGEEEGAKANTAPPQAAAEGGAGTGMLFFKMTPGPRTSPPFPYPLFCR